MENEVLHVISKRRSHRAYAPDQLTQAQLETVLDAALCSPSAVNRQPWHFSVVQDQGLLNKINEEARKVALTRDESLRNRRYADPNFQIFYHAPTVIFLSASPDSSYAPIDCGIAVENIALAAESLGLGSVILGLPRDAFSGDKREELEKALQFPEGYGFVIAIALGTATDDKPAHEKDRAKISFIR